METKVKNSSNVNSFRTLSKTRKDDFWECCVLKRSKFFRIEKVGSPGQKGWGPQEPHISESWGQIVAEFVFINLNF